jgi:hypothetical protein
MGVIDEVKLVEHPLEARGVVLEFGGATHVITAIDYCGLCNASHDLFCEKIAAAAGAKPGDVALQALHQHTAPVLDTDGARLLYAADEKTLEAHLRFSAEKADRVADAVKKALPNLQPVTRLVASRAKVERVASNRRVPAADGSILVRWSSNRDLDVRSKPEGLIDPWLRTLTFFSGDRPLAQLHYYATHPQSFYRDGRITWDVPGIARSRLERETGVFQVYFTGCGGNVTMGKYNDGTPEARAELSGRLYDAMRQAAAAGRATSSDDPFGGSAATDFVVDVARLDPRGISWQGAPLAFGVRDDGKFADAQLQKVFSGSSVADLRMTAAMNIAWNRRLRSGRLPNVTRLRIGPIQIVHLPGEPFVQFQLHAQQAAPKSFVCVAGYGECGVWYYGPDSIYRDRGGYEQTASYTAPCEARVKAVLDELLQP